MMYSVVDIAGINRLSRRILNNAAYALAGMIRHAGLEQESADDKVTLGIHDVRRDYPMRDPCEGNPRGEGLRSACIPCHRDRRPCDGGVDQGRLY